MAVEAAARGRFPGRSAAILAGGRSSRMGANKALLEVGGLGMLQRVAGLLRPLVDDLFVVADDAASFAHLGLRVVPDVLAGRGPAGGVHAAIAQAVEPLVLCVACDMPHVNPALLGLLLAEARPGDDALLPRVAGRPEPLLAVYGRGALAGFERALGAGRLRVVSALEGLRVRYLEEPALAAVDPGLHSFVNVNTPDELQAARARPGRPA